MEIENLTFKTEKEYKEFLDYLFSIRDIKYRDFNTKIVVPVDSEIMTYDNMPIDAKYFSTSSGFTSHASNVW